MKQKRRTTEEIIRIIRGAASDKGLEAVCRQHNLSSSASGGSAACRVKRWMRRPRATRSLHGHDPDASRAGQPRVEF